MIKNLVARAYNILILAMLFPWIVGCNKDGSSGGIIDSGLLYGQGGPSGPSGGEQIITPLHAPEPATLILLGTGIWALHLLKKRAQ